MVCTFFLAFFNTAMFFFLITRQKKQFPASCADLTMPVKKRNDLPSLGSPFIEKKFPQNPQADCPSELTDEDRVICPCLTSREAGKKRSDIFHLYKGPSTLPTENERSGGRWFKCIK